MASTDFEKMVLLFEANTRAVEKQLKKLNTDVDRTFKNSAKSTRQFNRALDRTQANLAKVGKVLIGAFAIGGVAQLPGAVRSLVADTARLGDVADKIGLTTEALQELRFAAELSGVPIQALDMGMQRFARRLAQAANGSGELYEILKANNVELRGADGRMRSQNDLLNDYANLIRNAGSEQEQLLLAFKAFDSEGAALVNMLRDGASGLDELRTAAHEAGGVIRDELVREMQEVDEEFDKLARTVGVTLKSAVLETVSAFRQLLGEASETRALLTGNIQEDVKNVQRLFRDQRDGLKQSLRNARAIGDPDEIRRVESELARVESRLHGIMEYRSAMMAGLQSGPTGRRGPRDGLNLSRAPLPLSKPQQTTIPTKAEDRSAAASKEQAINRVVMALEREALALAGSTEAQRLNNALAQAGVSIDSDAGQEIARRVEQIDRLAAANEMAARKQAQFNQAMSMAENIGMSFIDRLIDGTGDLGDALEDLSKDFAKMALQAALFGSGPLSGLSGQSSGGGLFGNLFKSFGGFRADGGPVASGKSYVVGERGPEIFVPKAPGAIVPNGAASSGAVHVTVSSDADGNLVPVIEKISGRVSAQVVSAAAPSIIDRSVSKSGQALASGEHDSAMRRFNAKPQAAIR